MNWRSYVSLLSFVVVALIFGIIGLVTDSTTIKWAAPAIGLALIAGGLGLNSFLIAIHVDRTMSTMNSILERIEQTQQNIQTELKQQEGSHSPIVASLQALSQYYLDFMSKQKEKEQRDKTEIS